VLLFVNRSGNCRLCVARIHHSHWLGGRFYPSHCLVLLSKYLLVLIFTYPPLKSCIRIWKNLTDRLTRNDFRMLSESYILNIAASIASVSASIRFLLYLYRHTKRTSEHRHWYFNSIKAWKMAMIRKEWISVPCWLKSYVFCCHELECLHHKKICFSVKHN